MAMRSSQNTTADYIGSAMIQSLNPLTCMACSQVNVTQQSRRTVRLGILPVATAFASILILSALFGNVDALGSRGGRHHRQEYEIEGGPKRLRLPDFSISLSPTANELSSIEASNVKGLAEALVEDSFSHHDWGNGTFYDYFGFAGIESIVWNPNGTNTVITVRGGVVSFTSDTTVVPSQNLVQTLIEEILDPIDSTTTGLTKALQQTDDLYFITTSKYDALAQATSAPTSSPTQPNEDFSPIVKDPAAPDTSVSSMIPITVGVAAGVMALALASTFFLLRHRQRKALWRDDVKHNHPDDDSELDTSTSKKALHARDSLDPAMSDAGSSRLGRILSATAAAVQGGRMVSSNQSEATPQSSCEDSQEDKFLDFDGTRTVAVEPVIVPVESRMESFEQSRRNFLSGFLIRKDVLTRGVEADSYVAQWQDVQRSALDSTECVLKPSHGLLGDLDIGPLGWNDASSQPSNDLQSDGEHVDFAPDESWDFNDNDDDSDVVTLDPFQTPEYAPPNDHKTLLRPSGRYQTR